MKDSVKLPGNYLWIYSGNEIINYEGKDYVVPAEGCEILDRMFPPEEEKEKKGGDRAQNDAMPKTDQNNKRPSPPSNGGPSEAEMIVGNCRVSSPARWAISW